MFFAALAHQYSYPHKPFHRNTPDGNNFTYNAFRAMWDVSDIREDIFEHFSVLCGSLSRRVRRRSTLAESDHLIPSGSSGSVYRSDYKTNERSSNTYGAVGSGRNEQNDGINIVKQTMAKDYSPQFGAAPKTTSYFQPTSSSSSSTRNDKSNSENTTNTSRSDTFIEIPIGMRKSDSTASDFGLNTPIDECGINVRGLEKDSCILKYPNV